VISTKHVVHDTKGKVIGEWGIRKLSHVGVLNPTKRRNVHISRQSLRSKFLSQLDDDSSIAWGYCLKSLSQNSKSQIELKFQVGDKIEVTHADLVVGADGIRSCVRGLVL
jgi:2-polyprenyl-6-methoxyphenol hydroxylase-like FAD-dependent oxidoreductase